MLFHFQILAHGFWRVGRVKANVYKTLTIIVQLTTIMVKEIIFILFSYKNYYLNIEVEIILESSSEVDKAV